MNFRDPRGLFREKPAEANEYEYEYDAPFYQDPRPPRGAIDNPGGGSATNEIPYQAVGGFYDAWSRLDTKCAGFIGNGMGAVDAKNAFMSQSFYRVYVPVTPTDGTVALAGGGSAIALNTGAFFDPTNVKEFTVTAEGVQIKSRNLVQEFADYFKLDPSRFGVAQFQSLVLLHELGHNLGGLENDRDSTSLSVTNTSNVIDNCFKDMKR